MSSHSTESQPLNAEALEKNLTEWAQSVPVLGLATATARKIILIASNAKGRKDDCHRIARQVYELIADARNVLEGKAETDLSWSSGRAISDLDGLLDKIEDRLRVFKHSFRITFHADERIADCDKHVISARRAVEALRKNNPKAEAPGRQATRLAELELSSSEAEIPLPGDDGSRLTTQIVKTATSATKVALTLAGDLVENAPVPGLKGAITALNRIIAIAEEASQNTETLQALRARVLYLVPAITGHDLKPSAMEIVKHLQRQVLDIKHQLENYRQGGKISSFFNSKEDAGFLDGCNQTLNRLLLDLQVITQVENASGIAELNRFVLSKDEDARFSGIPRVASAAYNSQARALASGCMEGTRVQVLERVEDWISNGAEPVFWVPGLAGTGKTTLSHTIAKNCDEHGILGGSFFFSRYEQDRSEARHVFTTIAFHLGNRYPSLKSELAKVMEDKTVVDQAFQHHLRRLIVKPLVNLDLPKSPPIVIVLDALDECEDDIASVLTSILAPDWEGRNTPLKFFITSRPDRYLQVKYSNPGVMGKKLVLHEVQPIDVQADIRRFLETRLAFIAKDHRDILPAGPWPSEEKVDLLVIKAGGLFIYASTVLNYISSQKGNPSKRLEVILSASSANTSQGPYSVLDSLYAHILEQATYDDFQVVVGTIILLAQRLSVRGLGDLLGMMPEDITICLRPLDSVIPSPVTVEEEVYAYHLSFHDYLIDNTRCKNPDSYIDPTLHHHRLTLACLARMERSLKQDICEIGDVSKLNNEVEDLETKKATHIPAGLQYAIIYWSSHIVQTSPQEDILARLEAFLAKHTLHWIETLSILGHVKDGITMIRQVSQWLPSTVSRNDLRALLYDTERMMMAFLVPITAAALQAYETAFSFMPRGVTLYRTLKTFGVKNSIRVLSGVREAWDQCLSVLEGHKEHVNTIMFSPDGEKIVSSSGDGTLRFWDPKTGACSHVLEGHEEWVQSFAFSPDGENIVSCSGDKTLRVWDVKSGACLRVLGGHPTEVNSFIFSPSGHNIVSQSDKVLYIWDSRSDALLGILNGHDEYIQMFMFSPDGDKIVSCSNDSTLRVWNANSGDCLHVLRGHKEWIASFAFSPCGERIVSCSGDKHLRVWDVESGDCLRVLAGHEDTVHSVKFFPDEEKFVSCSSDTTLRIWDLNSDVCLLVLKGHTREVESFQFSPDGQEIISTSNDDTLRVWDAKSGDCLRVLKGHTGSADFFAFSPDKAHIISCSRDRTIRVWDAKSGACLHILEGHAQEVTSFIYSPDEEKIVSCSPDWTIRIWDLPLNDDKSKILPLRDAKSSTSSYVLEGHADHVNVDPSSREEKISDQTSGDEAAKSDIYLQIPALPPHIAADSPLKFSPDRQQVAFSSNYETLRVWDANSGLYLHILEGQDPIGRYTFSPDGRNILSYSSSGTTLYLWDAKSGSCLHCLRGHTSTVKSFEFSPDGHNVVSCSDDKTLRIWDVASGNCSFVLKGHGSSVTTFEFSPNGKQIVSCSEDATLRIWDIKSGVGSYILKGHSNSVSSFKFSPNGQKVASYAEDKVLWVWDVESASLLYTLVGHEDRISAYAFSPSGEEIISSSFDTTLRVWDMQTGECSHVLAGHSDWVHTFAFSPDGEKIVSRSDDAVVCVWDVRSGACLHALPAGEGQFSIQCVAFSPNGEQILCCSSNALSFWDAKLGTCSQVLQGVVNLFSPKCFLLDKWLYLERGGYYSRICWFHDEPRDATLSHQRLVVTCVSGQVFIVDISLLL